MEAEVNFAANNKRRRSSLFVDRRSCIFDDSQEIPKDEPIVSSKNISAGEIQNYILNTKQCYKNWQIYENDIKSKLEAARHAKPLQFDEKTLMEFLTVEDRSFLKEAEGFLKRRSELTEELASVASSLEALVDQYEFNKQLCDVAYDDLSTLHQATVAKAVDDHQEMIKQKFGLFRISSEFPISKDAPQIFSYYSDSE